MKTFRQEFFGFLISLRDARRLGEKEPLDYATNLTGFSTTFSESAMTTNMPINQKGVKTILAPFIMRFMV